MPPLLWLVWCAQNPDGTFKSGVKTGVPALDNWNRLHRIETLLVGLKQIMARGEYKKLPQPPEGATYS